MTQLKMFTPKEANQMLPLIRKIVEDILRVGQEVRTVSVDIDKPEESPEVNDLMDQLDELFEELESLGCSYKDWNFTMGLVDFPALLDGREVLLCWKSDEASVAHYHDLESGFDGRKTIPADLLS